MAYLKSFALAPMLRHPGWRLGLILCLASMLRFSGLAWDDYQHYHPDERYIAWVASTIEMPASWRTTFSPRQSPLNPFYWHPEAESTGIVTPQDEPRAFAYGHLPLYVGVFATRLAEKGAAFRSILPASWRLTSDILNGAERNEFTHITIVGRTLTAWVDVGSVGLIYLLGRKLFGWAGGLMAAALLAINVMHIQLSHFYATDPFVTFFSVAAIAGMVWSLENLRALWLVGIMIGLAVGSKFAGIFLLIPLAYLLWQNKDDSLARKVGRFALVVAVACLAFALTNPYAFLDFNCETIVPAFHIGGWQIGELELGSCFLQNMVKQSGIVSGVTDIGFSRQYAGTTPYLYHLEMQLKWGMGAALGVAAIAGVIWGVLALLSHRRPPSLQSPTANPQSLTLILVWTLAFMTLTGYSHVKFMRYWQPITPFLMLLVAGMLSQLNGKWRWSLFALIWLPTMLYAFAFVNMYRQPHPWNEASRWIFANVPASSVIPVEQWDDPLPTSMRVDGDLQSRRVYRQEELTWLTFADHRDDEERLKLNLTQLAGADYLSVASHRVYGVIARQPERYPLSSQYHRLLFSGELGFVPIAVFGRAPQLAGISLAPDPFANLPIAPPSLAADYWTDQVDFSFGRADESFMVYDQPLTMIFVNRDKLSVAEMLGKFDLSSSSTSRNSFERPTNYSTNSPS